MLPYNTESTRQKLVELNERCRLDGIFMNVIVLGENALGLIYEDLGLNFRNTKDFDIINMEMIYKQYMEKYAVELEIDIAPERIMNPSFYDVISNQKELIPKYIRVFSNIDVYMPTLDMMIVIKSLTSRAKDIEDLINHNALNICNPKNTLQLLEFYSASILGREMTNYRYTKTVLERRIIMEGWL